MGGARDDDDDRTGDAVRWEGSRLVVRKHARLDRSFCWLCGTRRNVQVVPKTFADWPLWLLFLGPVGWYFALALQKKVEVFLPICVRCQRNWRLANAAYWAAGILGGIAAFLLTGLIGERFSREGGWYVGRVSGLVLWFAGLALTKVLVADTHQIRCARIVDDEVKLVLPRPEIVHDELAKAREES